MYTAHTSFKLALVAVLLAFSNALRCVTDSFLELFVAAVWSATASAWRSVSLGGHNHWFVSFNGFVNEWQPCSDGEVEWIDSATAILSSLESEILHRAEIELALDKERELPIHSRCEIWNCSHYGRHLSLQLIGMEG